MLNARLTAWKQLWEPHLRMRLLLVISSTRDNLMTFVPIYSVLNGIRRIKIYEFNTLRPTDWQYFVFQHLTSHVSTNAIEFCSIYIGKLPNKKKLDFDVKRTWWQRYYIQITWYLCTWENAIKVASSWRTPWGVTLAQLVKASVGQADVRRFEHHLGHNWLSCGVFLVKSRHFGLLLAQTIRPNWQAIQTWSIYKVYT